MSNTWGKFNGREHKPENGSVGFHAPGIFAATVNDAKITPTQGNSGAFFAITYKTDQGEIVQRHNLWNSNPKTVEIAQGELTSLCIAIDYYDIDFDKDGGRVIVGAPVMIEVGQQMVPSDPNNKQSPKVLHPSMTEVKRIFSAAGINPAKPSDAPVVPVLRELVASPGFQGGQPGAAASSGPAPDGGGAGAPAWNAPAAGGAPAGVVAAAPVAGVASAPVANVPIPGAVAAAPAVPPTVPTAPAAGATPPWTPRG